jgi:hypothetical protein
MDYSGCSEEAAGFALPRFWMETAMRIGIARALGLLVLFSAAGPVLAQPPGIMPAPVPEGAPALVT